VDHFATISSGISDYTARAPTFHPFAKPYPYLSARWDSIWYFHEIQSPSFRAYKSFKQWENA